MKSLATPAVVNTISAAYWPGDSLRASGLFKMIHLGQSLVNRYQASGQVTNEGTVALSPRADLGGFSRRLMRGSCHGVFTH